MREASRWATAAAAGLLLTGAAHAQELPPGPNRDLVYGQCRTCHDLQYLVESAGIPRDAWGDIIDSMQQYGLRVSPEQRAKLVDYLGTYLGPNPPEAAGTVPATAAQADGAAVFETQCSACHQKNGQGVAGQFPPLAGNRDLFLSRTFPAMVVLAGLDGSIDVSGRTFKSVMPPLLYLTDAEVAAVVNYVRAAWGNDTLKPAGLAPLDAAAVADVRAQNLTSAKVRAERSKLKAARK